MPSLFISYSSLDRAIAERIHAGLEAAGYDVWRDQTRLEQDWSQEIARALAAADAVVLLWSTDAAASKWVRHEWLTARALEKYILPCLLPGAPGLPAPLANVHGVAGAVANDLPAAVVDRLTAVESYRVGYDYTILPERAYIPFNPNPQFTGRREDLVALYLAVIGNLSKAGTTHVGVVGMAGIGKTQLVVEFAHRFGFGFPDGVFWIQAADADQWLQQLVELARDRLGLPIVDSGDGFTSRQYLYALEAYCNAHPAVLLVMDNVRDPELLNNEARLFGLTPLTLGCNLLFTSRKRSSIPGVITQSVDALEPAAALALLTGARASASVAERQSAIAICNAVAYLPLALTLAAGYLAKYADVSFGDYLAELEANTLGVIDIGEMTNEELATRHEASVTVTLAGQWSMLTDETARRLFILAGQFPETAIVADARIALLTGIAAKSRLDRPVTRALNLLADLHLLERMGPDRNAIRVHPLVREFAAALLPSGGVVELRRSAAACVQSAYDDPARVARETATRGVPEVIGDIALAIDWDAAAGKSELGVLQRLLDREQHNLRPAPNAAVQPSTVLQQLLYRSFNMGIDTIANRVRTTIQPPVFKPLAVSRREDPAVVRTFAGHTSAVKAIALAQDGRRIVSGSDDKSLVVWDVDTGQPLHTFTTGDDKSWRVDLSADGKFALSGGDGRRLMLFELATGRATNLFEGVRDRDAEAAGFHVDDVGAAAAGFHGDGPYTMSAWLGVTFAGWTGSTRTMVRKHKQLDGTIRQVRLNADGTRALIYVGSYPVEQDESGQWVPSNPNDRLVLIDTGSGEVLARFPGPLDPIGGIHLTPDEQVAVVGFRDSLLVWWLADGQVTRLSGAHTDWVTSIAMSADRRSVLSAGSDRTLVLWDVETGAAVRTFRGHSDTVNDVRFSPDGRHAVSASADRTLILWDLHAAESAESSIGHSDSVFGLAVNREGTRALTASFDKTMILWDVALGEPVRTYPGAPNSLMSVAMTRDEKLALTACGDNEVLVWDLDTGAIRHVLHGHRSWVTAVNFSPDGTRAVSGCRDLVIVWDVSTGKPISAARDSSYSRQYVGFTSDGRGVVTCGTGDIRIWDIVGQDLVQRRHLKGLWSSASDFDVEKNLSITSAVVSLYVWDLATGTLAKEFRAHRHNVQALRLTSDGKHAVTACKDERSVTLWDLDSEKELGRLFVSSPVVKMAIAGDRLIFVDEAWLFHVMKLAW